LAGPQQAIPTPHVHHHHHHVRIRRRKKFWRRPSWWSTVGKSLIIGMLAACLLFSIYVLWGGLALSAR